MASRVTALLELGRESVGDSLAEPAAVLLGCRRLIDQLIAIAPVRREDLPVAHHQGDAGGQSRVQGRFRAVRVRNPQGGRGGGSEGSLTPKGEGGTDASRPHGNSLDSELPQHRYEIERTDAEGLTETYKIGISGGRISDAGVSGRAQSQVKALNNSGDGWTYSSKVTGYASNRRDIVNMERDAVTEFFNTHGRMPFGNKRPRPW